VSRSKIRLRASRTMLRSQKKDATRIALVRVQLRTRSRIECLLAVAPL
jgi:hypothetical protein